MRRVAFLVLAWLTFGCGLMSAALATNPGGFLLGLALGALGLALLSE